MPVTHEFIRNTCAIPLSQYCTRPRKCMSRASCAPKGSSGVPMCIGGIPLNRRAAKRKNQVQSTKGNVNVDIFHFSHILSSPERTHVVIAAHNISPSHIQTVFPRNVGNAHPTRHPLNPHRPWPPLVSGN